MSKALYEALLKAQAGFQKAKKDGENPHLRNRFATLDAMVEATCDALHQNGLIVEQNATSVDGVLVMRTRIVHTPTGDATPPCDVPLLYEANNTKINPMQALGSAISYARRYGYESALGLLREDDDGEGAYHRQGSHGGHGGGAMPRPAQAPPRGQWGGNAAPAAPPGRASAGDKPPGAYRTWLQAAAASFELQDEWEMHHAMTAAARAENLIRFDPKDNKANFRAMAQLFESGEAWFGDNAARAVSEAAERANAR
jgi:hypothetical protein